MFYQHHFYIYECSSSKVESLSTEYILNAAVEILEGAVRNKLYLDDSEMKIIWHAA